MAPREDEKQKNSCHQCYIMKQEFVALALAIVFGTEWCILHTPHATDGNKQEVSRLFLHTKRDLQTQQVTFFSVYLKLYKRPLRNSQLRKRAFHNLEYTKSRRYSRKIVGSLH